MSPCRAAIVFERSEHRVGIDLVACVGQETSAAIAAHIVTGGCDGPAAGEEVTARRTVPEDRVTDVEATARVVNRSRSSYTGIAAEGAVSNRNGCADRGAV